MENACKFEYLNIYNYAIYLILKCSGMSKFVSLRYTAFQMRKGLNSKLFLSFFLFVLILFYNPHDWFVRKLRSFFLSQLNDWDM